ncbi:TIGR03862 family flavoprotein [Pseudothauera nasutitermitis]|uniref:TIGR03862 family flavoprotein n=1 Tax=Pseudothauera nasutitermitis TaxID=2565930 RepID=A0A4S4AWV0_9RHOO|nr:TIGR03862 family flavoprotein [Pseudothauera nasutitermitis]THF63755.1 TIGR03862 family flavoprotein [Pseudothauera nasutitermitis]
MSRSGAPRAIVVGGGPAGLMAAEVLAAGGVAIDLFDAMPTVGRKFLLAGRGGLNLTHAEAPADFLARYGERRAEIGPLLAAFGPQDLRDWVHGLGIETFVGSSGRVFPLGMKAAPLLRAWLARLHAAGVRIRVRERWQGWDETGALLFAGPAGQHTERSDAVVFALGGGSWARFGADARWIAPFAARGVPVAPLRPANCGFDVTGGWSDHLLARHAGQPLKNIALSFIDAQGQARSRAGECLLTRTGLEGGLVYALSAPLRDALEAAGQVEIRLDLLPVRDAAWVQARLARPRGSRSLASHLQGQLGLAGLKAALLYEVLGRRLPAEPVALAAAIKALPLVLSATRPLDEAISTAGGVAFEALDKRLMLQALPGTFCAGEMLDWEAPTGGYLLTACFASGRAAGQGALDWLSAR